MQCEWYPKIRARETANGTGKDVRSARNVLLNTLDGNGSTLDLLLGGFKQMDI